MHIIALLLQKQGRSAGLYEVAGAELVNQDVIQAVAVTFVRQLYCLLQGRRCSYAWADWLGFTQSRGDALARRNLLLWAQDEHVASLSCFAQIS